MQLSSLSTLRNTHVIKCTRLSPFFRGEPGNEASLAIHSIPLIARFACINNTLESKLVPSDMRVINIHWLLMFACVQEIGCIKYLFS